MNSKKMTITYIKSCLDHISSEQAIIGYARSVLTIGNLVKIKEENRLDLGGEILVWKRFGQMNSVFDQEVKRLKDNTARYEQELEKRKPGSKK